MTATITNKVGLRVSYEKQVDELVLLKKNGNSYEPYFNGVFLDNGQYEQNVDRIKGDGIYSASVEIIPDEAGTITLVAGVKNGDEWEIVSLPTTLNVSKLVAHSTNVESRIDSPIITAYMEQITGDKQEKRFLEVFEDSREVEVSSYKVGEVFKVTLELANGEKDYHYVYIANPDGFPEASRLNVGTENEVISHIHDYYTLIGPNDGSVKIVPGKGHLSEYKYYSFSKEGTHKFEELGINDFKINAGVIRVEGILMTYFTWYVQEEEF